MVVAAASRTPPEGGPARQSGMNLAGERESGIAKKMFFDGTNSSFCCKQRTYKSSMCRKGHTFDAKRTQIEAKKVPKTSFIWRPSAIHGPKSAGRQA
jgi:hypothetical protein